MIYWFLLMIGIVFADQITKWLAVILLKGQESFPLWEGVFHLTYVENTGAAFGILKDHRWVFMLLSSVMILGFLIYFVTQYKNMTPLFCCAMSMVIAGGVGNMIDRSTLGYVVDFFDFTLIDFAVFNVADSFVCIGGGLFVIWVILDTVNTWKAKRAEQVSAVVEEATEAVFAEEPLATEEASPVEPTSEESGGEAEADRDAFAQEERP